MKSLKTFSGFKGKCAFVCIGDIKFAILARTDRELQILWDGIMEGVPMDPSGIKSAILIESATLPEVGRRSPSAPCSVATGQAPSAPTITPITPLTTTIDV